MKIVIESDEFSPLREFDWPVIPRVGDWVTFDHRGGTDTYTVKAVVHDLASDGSYRTTRVVFEDR